MVLFSTVIDISPLWCSENFTGACSSLTGGAATIDQYFGDYVFDSFCCGGKGNTNRAGSTENKKCMLSYTIIVKCDKLDKLFNQVG